MSTPASTCRRTTWLTPARNSSSKAGWSIACPEARASTYSVIFGGRIMLPTCVVRYRSVLRFTSFLLRQPYPPDTPASYEAPLRDGSPPSFVPAALLQRSIRRVRKRTADRIQIHRSHAPPPANGLPLRREMSALSGRTPRAPPRRQI